MGSTGLDSLSCSTHQIGEDVVVPNAVLFQLHNLKDTTGGYSSVTVTAIVTKAVTRAADVHQLLTTCLLCPEHIKPYRPYQAPTVMLLASVRDEEEPCRVTQAPSYGAAMER